MYIWVWGGVGACGPLRSATGLYLTVKVNCGVILLSPFTIKKCQNK